MIDILTVLACAVALGMFIAVLVVSSVYNRLVGIRNETESTFANIDVELKKRTDLVPNLVETVKGYMKHEKDIFTRIAESREKMMGATTVEEKSKADNMLAGALKSLFAIAENYPDLKANQNFLQLQGELSKIEDSIANARQMYNDAVMRLNREIQLFPNNLVASLFGFREKEYFKTNEEDRKVPKIQF